MKTVEVIKKTREYLDYIEDHVNSVQKAWELLCSKCSDMRFVYDDYVYNEISTAIFKHDLSKLSSDEFVQYRKNFYPVSQKEKEESNFEPAWEHHKANNPHHWENWTKRKLTSPYDWEIQCVEMVCDWVAMGFRFNSNAQEYYEKNKGSIGIPAVAENFIYEIFGKIY